MPDYNNDTGSWAMDPNQEGAYVWQENPVAAVPLSVAAPTGSASNSVESLYTDILGRQSDAGGLAYWQQQFGDTVDPTERATFTGAAQAELANRTPAEQALLAPNLIGGLSTAVTTPVVGGLPPAQTDPDNPSGALPPPTTFLEGAAPATADEKVMQKLADQILATSDSSKWTGQGFGSPEANARAMASKLLEAGITDISQFGSTPNYQTIGEGPTTLNGQYVFPVRDDSGNIDHYMTYSSQTDDNRIVTPEEMAQATKSYGSYDDTGYFTATDPSTVKMINGVASVENGKNYINKLTGQQITANYDDKTGNDFSGTYAGEGRTGFGVQFTSAGQPIFYTQYGGTSNWLGQVLQISPIFSAAVNAAASYFGGPLGVAAVHMLAGEDISDVAKATALSYAAGQIASGVSATDAVVDALGKTGANVAGSGVASFVTSGGNINAAINAMATNGIAAGANEVLGSIPEYADLSKANQKIVANLVATTLQTGNLTPEQLIGAAFNVAKSEIAAQKSADYKPPVIEAVNPDDVITVDSNSAVTPPTDQYASVNTGTVSDAGGASGALPTVKPAVDPWAPIEPFTVAEGALPDTTPTPYQSSDFFAPAPEATVGPLNFGSTAPAPVTTDLGQLNTGFGTAQTSAPDSLVNPSVSPLTSYFGNTGTSLATNEAPSFSQTTPATSFAPDPAIQAQLADIENAPKFSDAFATARNLLGAGQTFTWQGKDYSTATAEENPALANKHATVATYSPSVVNAVTSQLTQNVNDPNFNPADLRAGEVSSFVNNFVNATPAQQQALLKGNDQMTYGVIDQLLKQTNQTSDADRALNALNERNLSTASSAYIDPRLIQSTDTIKPSEIPFAQTAANVGKTAANIVAGDVAGLGVRGAQFLGDLMGQDTNSMSQVQSLLSDAKDTSMSKLVGNEKVVAGGIASGIETSLAWALGGPLASVAMNAATVANNTWVEGANKFIAPNGSVFDSAEQAQAAGIGPNELRKLTPTENAQRTATMTALETAGEMLGIPGMRVIMKGLPIGGTAGQVANYVTKATAGLVNENVSELLTTVAQFSADKFASFGLNKNASFDDFKQAMQDTVLATTAAVGSASGIATAFNQASGTNTGAITDAQRTAYSPETLLTQGAAFGARPGDTTNQGVNPVTSEQVDFLKQDPVQQRSILDGLKNQFATMSLAAGMAMSGAAGATDTSMVAPTAITQTIAGTAAAPADLSTINAPQNTTASASIVNDVTTQIQTGVAPTAAINTAMTTAVQQGANASTALTAAVTSAVQAGTPATEAIQAAVQTAVGMGMNVDQALQTAMAAVAPATTQNVAEAVNPTVAPAPTVTTAVNPVTPTYPVTTVNPATPSVPVNPVETAVTPVVATQPTEVTQPTVSTPTGGLPTTTPTPGTTPATGTTPAAPSAPKTTTPTTKFALPATGGGGLRKITPYTDPVLDTTPTGLAGAPIQKAMKLAELHQLFDSLTPEIQAILEEHGSKPPPQEKASSKEDRTTSQDEKTDAEQAYENAIAAADAQLTPKELAEKYSTKFVATGGTIASIDPKIINYSPTLAAAPVPKEAEPSRMGTLTHMAQGPLKTPMQIKKLAHGGLPTKYAEAAPKGHKPEFITGLTGYYAQGGGTGQSDDIPAMLHDGDYVIDADAVAAFGDGSSKAGADVLAQFQKKIPYRKTTGGKVVPAQIADSEYVFPEAFVTAVGNGSNKAGAKMLDAMREELREHKRAAPNSKIPPKAKSPLDYLKMAKG